MPQACTLIRTTKHNNRLTALIIRVNSLEVAALEILAANPEVDVAVVPPAHVRILITGELKEQTAADVGPRPSEMAQQVGVGAAGFFQGVGEDGQVMEGPFIVDATGDDRYGASVAKNEIPGIWTAFRKLANPQFSLVHGKYGARALAFAPDGKTSPRGTRAPSSCGTWPPESSGAAGTRAVRAINVGEAHKVGVVGQAHAYPGADRHLAPGGLAGRPWPGRLRWRGS
jgi:hypothetical protein